MSANPWQKRKCPKVSLFMWSTDPEIPIEFPGAPKEWPATFCIWLFRALQTQQSTLHSECNLRIKPSIDDRASI
jgi:hypothetical protein